MSKKPSITVTSATPTIRAYDPFANMASTSDIKVSVDDWTCELVQPNHPALRKKATIDPFSVDADWEAREIEMCNLMHDKIGIGLACPQMGNSYNLFVMKHSILGDIGCFNPKILEEAGSEDLYEEGCLSFPLIYLQITRPEKVKVEYTKADGKTVIQTWMDGIDARCFQHEFEHLQGELFIQHVSDFKLQRAMKKRDKTIRRLQKELKKS